MTEYQYQIQYKGITIKSHFEMTEKLCEDYLDDIGVELELKDFRLKPESVIFIDDQTPYSKEKQWYFGIALETAPTVGELIDALSKLPKEMPYKKGYAALCPKYSYKTDDDIHIHAHTQLFCGD